LSRQAHSKPKTIGTHNGRRRRRGHSRLRCWCRRRCHRWKEADSREGSAQGETRERWIWMGRAGDWDWDWDQACCRAQASLCMCVCVDGPAMSRSDSCRVSSLVVGCRRQWTSRRTHEHQNLCRLVSSRSERGSSAGPTGAEVPGGTVSGDSYNSKDDSV